MLLPRKLSLVALLALALMGTLILAAHRAFASTRQVAVIEDDTALLADPAHTLAEMQSLGAGVVRVFLPWRNIAPAVGFTRKPAFNDRDPRAYDQAYWAIYDTIDQDAAADGLALEFVLTGPVPNWAEGGGILARSLSWEPNAADFENFVIAAGQRYGGRFVPTGQQRALPAVHRWEIWNEPNFGEDLAPQALNGSRLPVAPMYYRSLMNAAWSGLRASGHARDTIIIGELSARGEAGVGNARVPAGYPGIDGQTKPLIYVRELYCLDDSYHPLRGALAKQEGCPTTPAASRAFARQNPALFHASGFGIHPYPQGLPPTEDASRDPDFVSFNKIPNLEAALDRANAAYGSHAKLAVDNDEYGYITDPPNHISTAGAGGHFASPALAAEYINWAEYISWRNPRIATTMQYLLFDPNPYHAPEYGGFASGLINSPFVQGGTPKATYYAYRMPIFLPVTSTLPKRALEVWGAVRPAPAAARATHQIQTAQLQFAAGHSTTFRTIGTIRDTDPNGYYDIHLAFPTSGTLRVAYVDALANSLTYTDPLGTKTLYSRQVAISVR
jgi:hypothetical protein